ncbi:hypothetical protein IQ255_30505 [Pleurocapsales cyanobacterium LEGE 10410]|nr:hypothetical protein [Pleurocapsales cyanobacterium LEGE 10410]
MAKSNPSLADLSRMRREARQRDKAETVQKPQPRSTRNPERVVSDSSREEAKTVEQQQQTIAVQSDRLPQVSNDSKLEVVPDRQPSETEEPKKVGRPKGIRSNPEYESTTIRLHKQVKAKARYILSTQPEKMDLQTLLNNLLEDFVRQQKTE